MKGKQNTCITEVPESWKNSTASGDIHKFIHTDTEPLVCCRCRTTIYPGEQMIRYSVELPILCEECFKQLCIVIGEKIEETEIDESTRFERLFANVRSIPIAINPFAVISLDSVKNNGDK